MITWCIVPSIFYPILQHLFLANEAPFDSTINVELGPPVQEAIIDGRRGDQQPAPGEDLVPYDPGK